MQFHFGWTRNGYVATRFILLCSTAESSATNGYVVVPERSGQSEAQASRNVERSRKKPSSVPSSRFNQCSMKPHVNMNFIHQLCVSFIFDVVLLVSCYGKTVWSIVYVIIYCVGSGITTWMSISDGLDPYFFRRKMEKTRSMKEEMDGEVFISRQSREIFFPL